MNYGFSIDALSASGKQAWRLQTGPKQQWQACVFAAKLRPSDACIESKQEAQNWIGCRFKKDDKYGLIKSKKTGVFDFLSRGIFGHAILHRFSIAAMPSFEQMQEAIGQANPGTASLPYLSPAGHFAILDSQQTPIIGNLDIAVRADIASDPAFIGKQAVKNTAAMQLLYQQFMFAWLQHLQSGRMGLYIPASEGLTPLKKILKSIDHWQAETCAS